MNECLTTPQHKVDIGYWVSDKIYLCKLCLKIWQLQPNKQKQQQYPQSTRQFFSLIKKKIEKKIIKTLTLLHFSS